MRGLDPRIRLQKKAAQFNERPELIFLNSVYFPAISKTYDLKLRHKGKASPARSSNPLYGQKTSAA